FGCCCKITPFSFILLFTGFTCYLMLLFSFFQILAGILFLSLFSSSLKVSMCLYLAISELLLFLLAQAKFLFSCPAAD
ncbi:MAG: hypothetical protein ACK5NI_00015, partial [bacterium]